MKTRELWPQDIGARRGSARRGQSRRTLPVGVKIILPFAIFSLLVGVTVSTVVSRQLASSAAAQLDALSIREEDGVNASFDSFGQRQLADLRFLSGTEGVPAAAAARDPRRLRELLFPIVANQFPDRLRASVVGPDGRELLHLAVDPQRPDACDCSAGRDLSGWPHVGEVLRGQSDLRGPKFAGIAEDADGPLLFTVGPVVEKGRVVAAMVTGEPVADLLGRLREGGSALEAGLYRSDGSMVAHTPGFNLNSGAISPRERLWVVGRTGAVHHQMNAGSAQGVVFFVPWEIRGEPFGYAAVAQAADPVATASGNLTRALVVMFLAALVLTVLAGLFISRSITGPLSKLLQATRQVGGGNLLHRAPVTSADEIGELADSFNQMTATLQERTARLEFSSEATVRTLAAAIDARDPYTHGHSLRVAAYSDALGRAAGLDEEAMENIRRGCLVHDVGKIGVPDRILGKPGRLSDDEEQEMRRHPVKGQQMLRHQPWATEALLIVRHHHERWDGSGYPDQLAGDAIPSLARLVALADALDAMTSHRPYRRALSFDDAAHEITASSGTHFDPAMVAAFAQVRDELKLLREELGDDDEDPQIVLAALGMAV